MFYALKSGSFIVDVSHGRFTAHPIKSGSFKSTRSMGVHVDHVQLLDQTGWQRMEALELRSRTGGPLPFVTPRAVANPSTQGETP